MVRDSDRRSAARAIGVRTAQDSGVRLGATLDRTPSFADRRNSIPALWSRVKECRGYLCPDEAEASVRTRHGACEWNLHRPLHARLDERWCSDSKDKPYSGPQQSCRSIGASLDPSGPPYSTAGNAAEDRTAATRLSGCIRRAFLARARFDSSSSSSSEITSVSQFALAPNGSAGRTRRNVHVPCCGNCVHAASANSDKAARNKRRYNTTPA